MSKIPQIRLTNGLFSILFLFMSMTVLGQGDFVAKSSKFKVKKNERFQVSYSLNNSGSNFQGPSFKDFHVLGGPNPNSRVSIINGKRSSSITYSYILKPKKIGKFVIEAGSIESNSTTLKSNTITIQVVEGKTNEEIAVSELKDEIFIRILLNKNSAYQGEQIIATYTLYFSKNIQDINFNKIPSLKGFWQKELELNQKQRLGQAEYKGNTYQTYILKKSILIPQKFGKLLLDPMETTLQVSLPTKRRDMWGRWMTKKQEMLVTSPSREIQIKPLPMEGKPSNFTGAVGNFSFKSSLSEDSINTNETVSLAVQLSGEGNLPLFKIPNLKTPPDIEAYEPKTSDKLNYYSSGINGKKEDQYILIPRHKGSYTIPGLQFSYFDPKKKKYIHLESPSYALKVGGNGLGQHQQIITSISKENVEFIGKDVLYIKPTTLLSKDKETLFNRNTFIFWWLGPILFAVLLYLFKLFILDKEIDERSLRIKKAGRKALKHLDIAKGFIKKEDSTSFYSQSLDAIYDYLREKLNVDISDFQIDEIKSILNDKKVPGSLIADLESIIETCQIANYGPSKSSSSMEGDLVKSKEIITQLENLL